MTNNLKVITGVFILVAIGILLGQKLTGSRRAVSVFPMQQLHFKKLNGEAVDGKDIQEPLLIVNLWASWCEPCKAELPSLIELAKAQPNRIKLLAISQDEDRSKLDEFLKLFPNPPANFIYGWDPDGTLAKAIHVEKLPESFILNQKRELVKKIEGYDDWSGSGAKRFFDLILEEQI